MLINGCVFYRKQYLTIWRVSFLLFFSSLYAIYRGHYDLALVPGGTFCTSINYWRKPDYTWRRNLDRVYLRISFTYQLLRSYNAQYVILYNLIIFISILFFYIGLHFYKNKKYWWYSTYSHCMLHIGVNIANVILYSGTIPALITIV
jgi:hypothetical protein